jgi:hypothetical protein
MCFFKENVAAPKRCGVFCEVCGYVAFLGLLLVQSGALLREVTFVLFIIVSYFLC